MIFGRNEHKRANPYVVLTVGALAMIGAINVVRCCKNTVKCVKKRVKRTFHGTDIDECPIGE